MNKLRLESPLLTMMEEPLKPHAQRAAQRERVVCLAFVSCEDRPVVQGVARSVDLSPKGAGLITARSVGEGARVHVELLLPSSLRLKTTGTVVHERKLNEDEYRIGVAFERPPHLVSSAESLEE